MNILCIDDDTTIIPSLKGLLETSFRDHGVIVYHERSVDGGLRLCRQRTFALVLLDLLLDPLMNGDRRANRLATIKRIHEFPCAVMAYTGADEPDMIEAATDNGAVGYIVKGERAEDQIRKIWSVLSNVIAATVRFKTEQVIRPKPKGIRFNHELSWGHILQILVMVFMLIGVYVGLKTSLSELHGQLGLHEWRLIQLEENQKKQNAVIQQISDNQGAVAEKLQHMDGSKAAP